MKPLLFLLFLAAGARAAPFLICDPYPTAGVDPSLVPVSFNLTGLGSITSSPAFQQSDGTIILHVDLAALAKGTYTVMASAVNNVGEGSPSSVPFTFTQGVPSEPGNIRISPF